MVAPTKTDTNKFEWALTDEVVRLREWATDRIFPLPQELNEAVLGTSEECQVRLTDPSGMTSRMHARLVRDRATWTIHDAGSKNGIRLDGGVRPSFVLEPGSEIGIGKLTLIAESGRSIAVRRLLARVLGWTSDRGETVDLALRSVRAAAARRAALLVCSESDPVSIAHGIHRVAIGAERPFVSCDPKRKSSTETVRSVRNFSSVTEALAAAEGGSLCVWSSRLPDDFESVREALRRPDSRVLLVVCSNKPPDSTTLAAAPIVVPVLAQRDRELSRIVVEYAQDAMADAIAEAESFLPADRAWIIEHAAATLGDIETATSRIVALRHFGNVNRAAEFLGMAHVSLSRWIERRGLDWRPRP